MKKTEKVPAPARQIGGTADRGRNSAIGYRPVKSPLKMKKGN